MAEWMYMRTEPSLWTVGFYKPSGDWEPTTDHGSADEAAARVRWLNGGTDAAAIAELVADAIRVHTETEPHIHADGSTT